MSLFVISVGGYVPALTGEALTVARIGKGECVVSGIVTILAAKRPRWSQGLQVWVGDWPFGGSASQRDSFGVEEKSWYGRQDRRIGGLDRGIARILSSTPSGVAYW